MKKTYIILGIVAIVCMLVIGVVYLITRPTESQKDPTGESLSKVTNEQIANLLQKGIDYSHKNVYIEMSYDVSNQDPQKTTKKYYSDEEQIRVDWMNSTFLKTKEGKFYTSLENKLQEVQESMVQNILIYCYQIQEVLEWAKLQQLTNIQEEWIEGKKCVSFDYIAKEKNQAVYHIIVDQDTGLLVSYQYSHNGEHYDIQTTAVMPNSVDKKVFDI